MVYVAVFYISSISSQEKYPSSLNIIYLPLYNIQLQFGNEDVTKYKISKESQSQTIHL